MKDLFFTKPYYIFFTVLPSGISLGFVTVALPYLLTHNGFSVVQTAGIVAVGVSANIWRFLWGPIVDLSLSLCKWYWISIFSCTSALLLLCFTPITTKGIAWLTVIVFASQVAGTFLLLPVSGFMAKRIEENKKGRAAGYYQAGNLAGVGLGGGAGLWLAVHYGVAIAGFVLCAASILFAMAVLRIKDVQCSKDKNVSDKMALMGRDILKMVRIPVVLFIIIMFCMPIGTGAAGYLWSAIAADWKTDADTVALVTGILSGLVSAAGSVAGGYFTDHRGIWVSYLGSGIVCAMVTVIMALFPSQPYVYITGVLAYAFALGLINTAFSAVILFAIGKQNAATKFSLLSSLGNLPVVYMTAFDGWAHDKLNSKMMLLLEAALGIAFVAVCILVLKKMKARQLLLQPVD